jgi:trk system potassium uptake protein TrkA
MYIIVIGGGKVGFYLAKELVESNHEVLVIERDASKCGDGCEAAIQEQAGVGRADMMLAVTGDDEDNLVACQVARHIFNVPRTIARINNPKNEHIFRELGIDFTVSATSVVLSQIEQQLPSHPMIPLLQLRRGYELVEIRIPDGAAVEGKMIKEVLLPQQSIIWGIVDAEGNPKAHTPETVLHAGDDVVVLTLQESEEALRGAQAAPPPERSFKSHDQAQSSPARPTRASSRSRTAWRAPSRARWTCSCTTPPSQSGTSSSCRSSTA